MSSRAQAIDYYARVNPAPAQTVEDMMDREYSRSRGYIGEAPGSVSKKRRKTREKISIEVKAPSGISVLAVFGTIIVCGLMILLILAHVSYNEAAVEAARVSVEVRELTETHRALSLAFESSINIREVERIARDELGMSRPDAAQIITINTLPHDRVTVISQDEEENYIGFLEFIISLFAYFEQ